MIFLNLKSIYWVSLITGIILFVKTVPEKVTLGTNEPNFNDLQVELRGKLNIHSSFWLESYETDEDSVEVHLHSVHDINEKIPILSREGFNHFVFTARFEAVDFFGKRINQKEMKNKNYFGKSSMKISSFLFNPSFMLKEIAKNTKAFGFSQETFEKISEKYKEDFIVEDKDFYYYLSKTFSIILVLFFFFIFLDIKKSGYKFGMKVHPFCFFKSKSFVRGYFKKQEEEKANLIKEREEVNRKKEKEKTRLRAQELEEKKLEDFLEGIRLPSKVNNKILLNIFSNKDEELAKEYILKKFIYAWGYFNCYQKNFLLINCFKFLRYDAYKQSHIIKTIRELDGNFDNELIDNFLPKREEVIKPKVEEIKIKTSEEIFLDKIPSGYEDAFFDFQDIISSCNYDQKFLECFQGSKLDVELSILIYKIESILEERKFKKASNCSELMDSVVDFSLSELYSVIKALEFIDYEKLKWAVIPEYLEKIINKDWDSFLDKIEN